MFYTTPLDSARTDVKIYDVLHCSFLCGFCQCQRHPNYRDFRNRGSKYSIKFVQYFLYMLQYFLLGLKFSAVSCPFCDVLAILFSYRYYLEWYFSDDKNFFEYFRNLDSLFLKEPLFLLSLLLCWIKITGFCLGFRSYKFLLLLFFFCL